VERLDRSSTPLLPTSARGKRLGNSGRQRPVNDDAVTQTVVGAPHRQDSETCSKRETRRAPVHRAGSRAAAPGACPRQGRVQPGGCSEHRGPERRSRRRDMNGDSSGTASRVRRCEVGRPAALHGGQLFGPCRSTSIWSLGTSRPGWTSATSGPISLRRSTTTGGRSGPMSSDQMVTYDLVEARSDVGRTSG
jgi:hypothetical protein